MIDVDGVVADFFNHMLNTIRDIAKRDYPHNQYLIEALPKYEELPHYWCEDIMLSKHIEIFHEARKTNEFWSTLPEIPQAVNSIDKLRNTGHQIIFCTCPTITCREWERIRLEWLQKRFRWVNRDNLIVTGGKELIDADAIIDDCQDFTNKWLQTRSTQNPGRTYQVFLFDAPYNRGQRTWVWQEITRKLIK